MNVFQEMESYPVKTHFSKEICIFYPHCEGNEKSTIFVSIETHLTGFLDPINVHLDTNCIIIALTKAKIWTMLYCCKWWRTFLITHIFQIWRVILVVSLDNFFPIALRYFHAKERTKWMFYRGGKWKVTLLKRIFLRNLDILPPFWG